MWKRVSWNSLFSILNLLSRQLAIREVSRVPIEVFFYGNSLLWIDTDNKMISDVRALRIFVSFCFTRKKNELGNRKRKGKERKGKEWTAKRFKKKPNRSLSCFNMKGKEWSLWREYKGFRNIGNAIIGSWTTKIRGREGERMNTCTYLME